MKLMRYILCLVSIFILCSINLKAQSAQICDLYGAVFVENNPKNADYIVFIEEAESAANMLVFQEDNRLFADKKGAWFFTKNRGTANFTIYFETDRRYADFSIYYTEVASFAGCQ
jgi:hypothetical protein